MTRIAVVGGGPAATIHAEAVRMAPSTELVGVGGRPGSAGSLAAALRVEDLPLDQLVERADALIVAVPPSETREVMTTVGGRADALLVESPVATTVSDAMALASGPPVMTAANLLHSPVVRRGLRAMAELLRPHHLELRVRAPRPSWGSHASAAFGGGAVLDPGARLLPLLLAVAQSPVVGVAATIDHDEGVDTRDRLTLTLGDGRTATVSIEWDAVELSAQLEVADRKGVVLLDVLPQPTLECDGRTMPPPAADEPALVTLGFVDQVRRLASVARGEAAPWADVAVGVGAVTVAVTAAMSAAAGGAERPCRDVVLDSSPCAVLSAGGGAAGG